MILDATAPEIASDDKLSQFLADFEACRIAKRDWTHAAHIAMAGTYLLTHPLKEALPLARTGIQRFNAHHGGAPELYHETLTCLWIYLCSAFLNELGSTGAEAIRALVFQYGRSSAVDEYYSFDVTKSDEARGGWVLPDTQFVPAAWRRERRLVTTNPRFLHMPSVRGWCKGVTAQLLPRTLSGSLHFGLYEDGRQTGYARVVTDGATCASLRECVGDDWLRQCIREHPNLRNAIWI